MADAPPALLLAAGRGERLRPLTDRTPKPLLPVRGRPLIAWHLSALAASGVRDVVVNTAWLEDQFPAALGDGAAFGLRIRYAMEGRDHGGALETAGGMVNALPLLQSDTFWAVAADVWMPDFAFDAQAVADFTASGDQALLWMVANPPHHPGGDFGLDPQGRLLAAGDPRTGRRYTYAGLGLFHSSLVAGVQAGERAALRPHLDRAIAEGRLGGRLHGGRWVDVGTIERWAALQDG